MKRLDIINFLIRNNNLKTYLEIGVHKGIVLNGCIAEKKIGVDPDCEIYEGENQVRCCTSDEFFELNTDMYDIIFIDGLHDSNQVYKDIMNSLKWLSPNGYIIVHDCNPPSEWHTRPYKEYDRKKAWNGDTYKGYIKAVYDNKILHLTVDTDWGVGIIRNERVIHETIPEITWKYFNMNRKKLLNLISIKQFIETFNNKI